MNQKNLDILAPLSKAKFLSDHWEQAPLHIARTRSSHFQELLSLTDIASLLSTGSQQFPDVQLINAAASVSLQDYTDKHKNIVAPALWSQYEKGSTIVISGAERKFTKLTDYCRSVSKALCMRSQANVYLSPANNQGFNPHYDTHDVFILQVSGSKLFRFYQSDVKLPFTEDTFPPDFLIKHTLQDKIMLSAGDTLYIPRGVVHDAVAQDEGPSLHITLGVFALVIRDILQEALQVLAEREVDLRRAVDLQSSNSAEAILNMQEWLASAISKPLLDEVRSRLLDEVAVAMTPYTDAYHKKVTTGSSSQITINKGALISVEQNEAHLKLRVAGQVLEFPEPYASAVQQLVSKQTLCISEFTNIDEDQCKALLDQLCKAGCITVDVVG